MEAVMDKYKGTLEPPPIAGTAPPIVFGKMNPESEFHYVATPMIEAGIPVPWAVQNRKDCGHRDISIWKTGSKMNETTLFGRK